MKMRLLATTISALSLMACGGSDDEQVVDQKRVEASVAPSAMYFAYPSDGQASVPTSAPIVLRYTAPIETQDIEQRYLLRAKNGTEIAFANAEYTNNNQGVVLHPEKSLAPGTEYTLVTGGVTVNGALQTFDEKITFRTAAKTDGPLALQQDTPGNFKLQRLVPFGDIQSKAGSNRYPLTDMSSVRLQLSGPVNSSSVVYKALDQGGSVSMLDDAGELVEAQVYVRNNRITIDPDADLSADKSYTVTLTDSVKSRYGDYSLPEVSFELAPVRSSSPTGARERIAQTASNDQGVMPLTGGINNSFGLNSLLLGNSSETVQTGTVYADIAFIPDFERRNQSTPIRVSAGSMMSGTSVDVLVAGEIPAGFESEEVNIHFLSDADGYLIPNPYTDDPSAPRLVELYADLSMTTGNAIANAGLAQSILHAQMVGTAIVEDGKLTLEMTGVVEPEVLGVDVASSLISFRVQGYRNAIDAPVEELARDVTPPTLKSWVPGENAEKYQPGDPVMLYFSEPLLPSSVDVQTLSLTTPQGTNVPVDITLNGAALTMYPKIPLSYTQEYVVGVSGSVTDLSKNAISPLELMFSLAETEVMSAGSPEAQSPLVLTAQPGYPCAKSAGSPVQGDQGRCLGGGQYDDLLPVLPHPPQRPISIDFSQNMNRSSINKNSVSLEKRNEDGSWSALAFEIDVKPRSMMLLPEDPWERDVLYRYTLRSGESGIQSAVGLPLQTRFLDQNVRHLDDRMAGGPDMINYFTGGLDDRRVFTPLRNMSTADVNSDLQVEDPERGVVADINGEVAPIANSSQVLITETSSDPVSVLDLLVVSDNPVTGAQIGCAVGEQCPEKSFIYMTGGLQGAVSGEAVDGVVSVKLYPTNIFTTSSDVHVEVDESLKALTGDIEAIPTGPMSMRMRFQEDENGIRNQLIDGRIFQDASGQLVFETELDLYIDAPFLEPELLGTVLNHGLRSFPLDGLKLRGPVEFLDDGRMQIVQNNIERVDLEGIGISGSLLGLIPLNIEMTMSIPENGLYLNYVSPIVEN